MTGQFAVVLDFVSAYAIPERTHKIGKIAKDIDAAISFIVTPNGLAHLLPVSSAAVASARVVTDTAGDQCSDLFGVISTRHWAK